MDQKKVGNFLAQLRKEKGLSQKELARIVGVTDKTVSRWETGSYMPDIDTFAVLSDYYGVLINEMIAGERLNDAQTVIKHSEENIRSIARDIARDFRRRLKIVCTAAVAVMICLSLVFLSVCCMMFLNKRREMLYPEICNADEVIDKRVMGRLEVTRSAAADLFEDDIDGRTIAFGLPEGYAKVDRSNHDVTGEIYSNGDSYIRIRVLDESEIPVPVNMELPRYFGQEGITRLVDKVNFAGYYDLDDVTVFDSEYNIGIAGGVRMILNSFSSHNRDVEEPGYFYSLGGDYRGFVTSDSPYSQDKNTWFINIENGNDIVLVTFVYPPIHSEEDLANFISSFNFK